MGEEMLVASPLSSSRLTRFVGDRLGRFANDLSLVSRRLYMSDINTIWLLFSSAHAGSGATNANR